MRSIWQRWEWGAKNPRLTMREGSWPMAPSSDYRRDDENLKLHCFADMVVFPALCTLIRKAIFMWKRTVCCVQYVQYIHKNFRQWTDVYPHMPNLRPHAARFYERRITSVTLTSAHLYGNVYMRVDVARALAYSSEFGLLGANFPKMGDSLPWTPMNHREKYSLYSRRRNP